jgi:hypothetical protein
MLEADILERIDRCIRELEAIRAALVASTPAANGAGPKVPMTRRRAAGVRDRGPPGGRLRAHLQRAGSAIQNISGLPQGLEGRPAAGWGCGRLSARASRRR